jgi:hypothetical protein
MAREMVPWRLPTAPLTRDGRYDVHHWLRARLQRQRP